MAKTILLYLVAHVCFCSIALSQSHDGTVNCPFGSLAYRVYFPENFTDTTCVIHVSRGGNGIGDDRGLLLSYVNHYVQNGYVVVQIDHRFAGSNIEQIAQFRGEEITCICEKVTIDELDYGGFLGNIDPENQGFAGHSGGCMEGLEAAGTAMTHGNYLVPQIKAVFGMSPAGYSPDQFGIINNPPGFGNIQNTAVFVVIGEEEKDINGGGTFMATDWRLQAYDAMNEVAPRFEAFVKGEGSDHNDISGNNTAIRQFNLDNSLAFFNTYLKNMNQFAEIGTISLPPDNPLIFSKKGIGATPTIETKNTYHFRLFPNPSESILYLDNTENVNVLLTRIFDALGGLVLENFNFPVDISGLPSGVYNVQILDDSRQFFYGRFIKQ
jgi:Secretion system C-terminal sorting domain